ncbi:hypothetical protein N7462_010563 [Penicillium macrosclerotiorum]|uniref:uncharacterized protein n=1 Tax=Penicillium macrosclerotiorum TaxID=303699 RepID=UPI002548058A|nr:uncharacterized protein N7462_010563 [Penicillium macrosclerotiorum]KAJ5669493.1 hypothetical protein N7462_010563 [Penicillium macrosclerotiorum]
MDNINAYHLSVFPYSLDDQEQGGNPTTIYLNADGMSHTEMHTLAKDSGHECGFVSSIKVEEDSFCDFQMQYWVPNHEMEMCGHATVGAVWIMNQLGLLPNSGKTSILTKSGRVEVQVIREHGNPEPRILVSQPPGIVENLSDDHVLEIVSCLKITTDQLSSANKVQNGRTSRTKTLIPIKNRDILDGINPESNSVREICEKIGSTGLYPYVILNAEDQLVEARQFPKSSGYKEDSATGVAAAALVFSLLHDGQIAAGTAKPIVVRQGWSMGRPSEIQVDLKEKNGNVEGCWISGKVRWLK